MPAWPSVDRLLVVRADNIGDVLMTAPALSALRAALPRATITLLASPAGAAAAPLLPWVDDVIAKRVLWQDLGARPVDAAREWRFVARLAERRFDAVAVLTSFSQSPHGAAFAAWLAGIPLRAGASREASPYLTDRTPFCPVPTHQVDRNLALIEALGFAAAERALAIAVPHAARTSAAELLAAHGLRSGAPYVLLNPWATAAARTYDPRRSLAAARIVAAETGLPIVITATRREAPRTTELLGALPPFDAVNLAGATSVPELAALVGGARLVITNNTAAMHMADALGTPAVVVYSGTELESQWAPRRSPHVLLRKPTPCTPCYAFECPRDHECVDFLPGEVANAAVRLLAQTERWPPARGSPRTVESRPGAA